MDTEELKEIIQLNLTKKELIILQAIAAVATAARLRDMIRFTKYMQCMEHYMNKWPESSYSLADKMTNSLGATTEIPKVK